jgi:Zinc carboxypeptidase/Secretion system C-terminal sorting domain
MRDQGIHLRQAPGSFMLMALKSVRQFGFLISVIISVSLTNLQQTFSQHADTSILFPNGRPELYFRFFKPANLSIVDISNIISIDSRRGDTLYAYANRKQFRRFQQLNLSCEILTAPSLITKAVMSDNAKGIQAWDTYPTYSAYVQMMQNFVAAYPSLCRLDTIGTSVNGHLLLFLEVSNHPGVIERKPEFMYSSTMHGDEVTGYILMLHLIDYLLSNYGNDSLVRRLVNNLHIWINPLANPDGTYYGGDNTVTGAIRTFSDGVDPNRNYPDPQYGPHPDGELWQKETVAMMNFMHQHHFVMSANFHGGDEVVNYPWDTWEKRHPDESWLQFISKEFADSVQHYGPAGYFTSVTSDGYIDGYDWYTISGGRQDYMTYIMHGRETTIELSVDKTPPASDLPGYWTACYRSFLHYMEESTFGLHGLISDSISGNPLKAKIEIAAHDADNSEAYSDSITGYFVRLIAAGNYNFTVSATGYYSRVVSATITNHQMLVQNIKLLPNKYPPMLKDNSGKKIDSLVLDIKEDSIKNICLHISDPEKQLAYIDTVLTSNSNINTSFMHYDSCLVLKPSNSFFGADTMKLVICDNGNPPLCDTVPIIVQVSKSTLVESFMQVNSFTSYPNPFEEELTIEIINNDESEKSLIIYDISGKECLNEKFQGSQKTLQLGLLGRGFYLLKVFSNSGLIGSQKLIKLK